MTTIKSLIYADKDLELDYSKKQNLLYCAADAEKSDGITTFEQWKALSVKEQKKIRMGLYFYLCKKKDEESNKEQSIKADTSIQQTKNKFTWKFTGSNFGRVMRLFIEGNVDWANEIIGAYAVFRDNESTTINASDEIYVCNSLIMAGFEDAGECGGGGSEKKIKPDFAMPLTAR